MTEVFIDTSHSLCFVIYDAVEAVEECITEAERSSEKWKARGGKCDPADDAVIVDIHNANPSPVGRADGARASMDGLYGRFSN